MALKRPRPRIEKKTLPENAVASVKAKLAKYLPEAEEELFDERDFAIQHSPSRQSDEPPEAA